MSISLRQDQRLSIKQRQELKLVASPQLRLFLKLLQKPQLELQEYIAQEMKENPVLEDSSEENESTKKDGIQDKAVAGTLDANPMSPAIINQFDSQHFMEYYSRMRGDENQGIRRKNDEPPIVETIVSKGETLDDHLMWQLRLSDNTPDEQEIGKYIIGNLDIDGFLSDITVEEIANTLETDIESVEKVRRQIMTFDPVGCAAHSVQESLVVQVRAFMPDNKVLLKLVEEHIEQLEKGNYENIEKALKIDHETLGKLVVLLRQMDLHPGASMASDAPIYVTPDVFIIKEGDDYRVTVNDNGQPKLRISSYYERILNSQTATVEEKEYVKTKIHKAMDLIKSIRQRQQTLKQITESIVRVQKDFFDKGLAFLKPLKQRDIAEDISVHESTVSRATANRYVDTPRGMLPLKFFFNTGVENRNGSDVSSTAVQAMIKSLIKNEKPDEPLTDDRLMEILGLKGIKVARRTVAKYRTKMGIPSSGKRKKLRRLL